jgi:hypothetical protein
MRGRRRQVDTSTHFCPNPDCAYRGWVGWGNLHANGHPNGGPWRQLLCVACRRYFLETLGTIFHGNTIQGHYGRSYQSGPPAPKVVLTG